MPCLASHLNYTQRGIHRARWTIGPGPRDLRPSRAWTRNTVRDELRVPACDLRYASLHVYACYRELHDPALARTPSTAVREAV
jgi:hypothetical protein